MMKISKLIFLHVVVLISLQTWASPPKVGLALGGGGAKGAATIGALKVVEKAGIKVDYIAGTSIGAIIGGLYASGYTISEMETLFLSQDWQDILEGHRIDAKLFKTQVFRSDVWLQIRRPWKKLSFQVVPFL